MHSYSFRCEVNFKFSFLKSLYIYIYLIYKFIGIVRMRRKLCKELKIKHIQHKINIFLQNFVHLLLGVSHIKINLNCFHVSELYASNKITRCTFCMLRIILYKCAYFSKNSKEIRIQSTINGKLICINVFTLKLIFCNCFECGKCTENL